MTATVTCDWAPRCPDPSAHRVASGSRPGLLLNVCERHMADAERQGYRRYGPPDGWGDEEPQR